jgi:hypothetical protein
MYLSFHLRVNSLSLYNMPILTMRDAVVLQCCLCAVDGNCNMCTPSIAPWEQHLKSSSSMPSAVLSQPPVCALQRLYV